MYKCCDFHDLANLIFSLEHIWHACTHTHSRWIRLLFGREFPLPSVLEMWDAIFADGPSLSLVDYICVAMLMHIREVRESGWVGVVTKGELGVGIKWVWCKLYMAYWFRLV